MKDRKVLLRVAGALCLLICLGHTVGTFMPIPVEQTEVTKATAVMNATLVPMPVGAARTFGDLFRGNNIAVSLFLLLLGLNFFTLATAEPATATRGLVALATVGAAGFAVISAIYFFPVPAIFMGCAALLGFMSNRASR